MQFANFDESISALDSDEQYKGQGDIERRFYHTFILSYYL